LALYENREFAVEILENGPERLSPHHMVFNVIPFDRATYTFGPSVEVLFSTWTSARSSPQSQMQAPENHLECDPTKNENTHPLDYHHHDYHDHGPHWMDALLVAIEKALGIPAAAAQVAKPLQTSEVDVLEVEDFSWIGREDGRRYMVPSTFANYGDRLVVWNRDVPLKPLTKEERGDLQRKIDAYGHNHHIDMMPVNMNHHQNHHAHATTNASNHGRPSTYRPPSYAKPKEAALVIRTNKQNHPSQLPPACSASSNDSNSNRVPELSPVADNPPFVMSSSAADDRDFERQGGQDMFNDLH
jgi:hypothetical protein